MEVITITNFRTQGFRTVKTSLVNCSSKDGNFSQFGLTQKPNLILSCMGFSTFCGYTHPSITGKL